MTSLQYSLNFAPTLDNLKSYQWTRNSIAGIAALKFFEESLSTNFGLIAVFVKVALEITKKLSIAFYWFTCFHVFFFEIEDVYLRSAGCRVYKGHLQNEWVKKAFRKHSKSSRSILSTAFSSSIICTLFVEIPRYLEIPLTDFFETSQNRRQAPKVLACEPQTYFLSSLLSLRKITCANPSGKRFPWRKTFVLMLANQIKGLSYQLRFGTWISRRLTRFPAT